MASPATAATAKPRSTRAKTAAPDTALPVDQHPHQLADGEWHKEPDAVYEDLPNVVSGLPQYLIVTYIVHETVSNWRDTGARPRLTKPMSAADFAKPARLKGADRAYLRGVLRDAIERGLIARYTVDGKLAPITKAEMREDGTEPAKGKGGPVKYCYRALWLNWKFCPKYEPKLKVVVDNTAVNEENSEDTVNQSGGVVPASAFRPLKPGVKLKDAPYPKATTRYRVESEDAEAAVAMIPEGDLLRIIMRKPGAAPPHSKKADTKNKRVTVSELREYLTPIFRDRKLVLGDDLLKLIHKELGDRPMLQFRSGVASAIDDFAKKKQPVKTGLFVWAAQKFCHEGDLAAWDRAAEAERAMVANADTQRATEYQLEQRQRAKLVAENRAILEDPKASEEDRRWARELLESLS